jgi:hypothetical protein
MPTGKPGHEKPNVKYVTASFQFPILGSPSPGCLVAGMTRYEPNQTIEMVIQNDSAA